MYSGASLGEGARGEQLPQDFLGVYKIGGKPKLKKSTRYGHYLEVSPQDFQNPIDAPGFIYCKNDSFQNTFKTDLETKDTALQNEIVST